MDDALAREDNVALVKQAFVLILVVMDDALVLRKIGIRKRFATS